MALNFLATLSDHELQTLCVPLEHCISVRTGSVDSNILAKLETNGFDQAPVYDPTGKHVLGLISTERLRDISAKNGEVAADDSEIRSDDHNLCIGGFLDLETLLSTMSKRRAVFVIRESDATEHGYHAWNYGLLTISDLNRHGLRGALYRLFSEVESGLAKLIETSLGEPWEWIRVLTESHQVGILGYWELSKRKGIDIGPIAATTLTQLLQVVARSKELQSILGYNSRSEFEKTSGHIPEIRNRVMHPVRPLVLGMEDVAFLRDTVSSVLQLYKAVERARNPKKTG